jgi:hypothetical protein
VLVSRMVAQKNIRNWRIRVRQKPGSHYEPVGNNSFVVQGFKTESAKFLQDAIAISASIAV